MFDFEKLEVYKKVRNYNFEVREITNSKNFDSATKDQLHRASLSIMLNIAEGSARKTNRDRAHFLVMARGSLFECISVFDYLSHCGLIPKAKYEDYYEVLEEISKMLYALIKHYNNR